MRAFKRLYQICKDSHSNVLFVALKFIYFKLNAKNIIAHPRVFIRGLRNIAITQGIAKIGLNSEGFLHPCDNTFLNIGGQLKINGNVMIGRGCRFDIAETAVVTLGKDVYINSFTKIIIMNSLEIGEGTVIAWECQLLDEDFHDLTYEGKVELQDKSIKIGKNV